MSMSMANITTREHGDMPSQGSSGDHVGVSGCEELPPPLTDFGALDS